jgi:phosphate transport system permease protein
MNQPTSTAMAGPVPGLAFRKLRDRIIETLLLGAALVAVFTTLAIVFVLVRESLPFFEHVSLRDFLTDTMWAPLVCVARYGILPLVGGTMVTTRVARAVAIAAGPIIAV